MTGSTRRVAAGAAWLYLQRWLDRLLEFAAIVVLARILSPADFGLVAVAASMVTIVEGVTALGVEKALIRSRGDDARLYDTAWTLSVLRGLLVAAVMLAIALALDDPRVAAIVRVLSIVPIFNGLANPMFVTFERDLIYSRLAVLTLGAKVASVAATIAAAFAWRNALGARRRAADQQPRRIRPQLRAPALPAALLAGAPLRAVRLHRLADADQRGHGVVDGDRPHHRRLAARASPTPVFTT